MSGMKETQYNKGKTHCFANILSSILTICFISTTMDSKIVSIADPRWPRRPSLISIKYHFLASLRRAAGCATNYLATFVEKIFKRQVPGKRMNFQTYKKRPRFHGLWRSC